MSLPLLFSVEFVKVVLATLPAKAIRIVGIIETEIEIERVIRIKV